MKRRNSNKWERNRYHQIADICKTNCPRSNRFKRGKKIRNEIAQSFQRQIAYEDYDIWSPEELHLDWWGPMEKPYGSRYMAWKISQGWNALNLQNWSLGFWYYTKQQYRKYPLGYPRLTFKDIRKLKKHFQFQAAKAVVDFEYDINAWSDFSKRA